MALRVTRSPFLGALLLPRDRGCLLSHLGCTPGRHGLLRPQSQRCLLGRHLRRRLRPRLFPCGGGGLASGLGGSGCQRGRRRGWCLGGSRRQRRRLLPPVPGHLCLTAPVPSPASGLPGRMAPPTGGLLRRVAPPAPGLQAAPGGGAVPLKAYRQRDGCLHGSLLHVVVCLLAPLGPQRPCGLQGLNVERSERGDTPVQLLRLEVQRSDRGGPSQFLPHVVEHRHCRTNGGCCAYRAHGLALERRGWRGRRLRVCGRRTCSLARTAILGGGGSSPLACSTRAAASLVD
mmetsp:Transcript_44775/g.124496  ORF Transcript_44775/g.124496 Transcript_44775/m.124496 type:complete len:288 (-) Transcript_44775:235-1098(-)